MDEHLETSRYAIKTLEKALRIYTPSLSEKALADFLADRCDDLGFRDIHQDEVGNLIATKGSGEPKIMLCGHMDVVPGKVKVRKEGDALYGRGASDAKAPLMAMLFAAASIEKNQGTVTFVGAVDEEGNAIGIKNIVKKEMDVDYAVFGEPSGIKQVTIAYKGRLAINLKISVPDSSHASAPWLSKNAIEESMIFVKELKEKLESNQDGKTKGMLLTATMTEIKGGTSHNITPKECETLFDIRIPVDMNCNDVEEKITRIVNEISIKREIEVLYSVIDEKVSIDEFVKGIEILKKSLHHLKRLHDRTK